MKHTYFNALLSHLSTRVHWGEQPLLETSASQMCALLKYNVTITCY